MTFLNPFALVGLAAAALPLLLHLLQRRRLRTIEFSTIRFIQELQRTRIRRLKLRQLLLLILRTLLVLLVVLAFSRPAIRSNAAWSPAHEARMTAVLLIDNSASMTRSDAGGTYLRQARDRALAVLESLNDGDDIVAGPFSDCENSGVPLQPVRSRAAADVLLQNIAPSTLHVLLGSVLDQALRAANASTHLQTEIHLFSDFQSGLLPPTDDRPSVLPPLPAGRLTVILHPVGAETADNVSLDTVTIHSTIILPNRPVELFASVRNRSSRVIQDRLVSVFLEGARVAQRSVDIEPWGTVSVPLSIVPPSTGFLSGFVELEDDEFPDDNRWFFSFRVPSQTAVLTVGSASDTRFIELALSATMDGASPVSVATVRPEALLPAHIRSADVVILAHAAQLTAVQLEALKAFLDSGGGLLIFPGPATSLEFWNSAVAAALDVPSADSVLQRSPVPGTPGEEGFRIGGSELRHPLFEGMFEDHVPPTTPAGGHSRGTTSIESPEVMRALRLRLRPRDLALLTLANGAPFLAESAGGGILTFSTGSTGAWSDFPRTGLFVPLLRQAVTHLAHRQALQPGIASGGEVRVRLRRAGATVTVVGPEGRAVVVPRPSDPSAPLRFRAEPITGTFLVRSDNTLLASFSSNLDRRESDLRRAPEEKIADAVAAHGIPSGSIMFLKAGEEVNALLARVRHGLELWKFALIAGLVVAIAESLVARETRKAEELTMTSGE